MRSPNNLLVSLFLLTALPALAQENAEQLLELHNQTRIDGYRCGLLKHQQASPLVWNNKLAQAAKRHAKAMASSKQLSHKLEGSMGQRLSREDYNWLAVGENLLMGFSSAIAAHNAWLKSKSHCKNIMNKLYTEMGAAHYQNYWVVVFATPTEENWFFSYAT